MKLARRIKECDPDKNAAARCEEASGIRASTCHPDVIEGLSVLYPGVPLNLSSNAAFRSSAHTEALVWLAIRDLSHQAQYGMRIGSRAEILGHLERTIDPLLLAGVTSNLLVHAGVVVASTGAIILPAPSGSGKSTLVSALSLAGYTYFSDEVAILDVPSGALHPFPKSICLKPGGWRALLADYGAPAHTATVTRATGETVRLFAPDRAAAPDTVSDARFIIIPEREPGSCASLVAATCTEALAALLGQSLNLPDHGPGGMERLAQTVEGARCFRLTYDSLEEAVAAISELMPPEPRPGAPYDGEQNHV